MSYCHLCANQQDDIAFTFGGFWNEGNRNKLDSWQNTPGVEVSYSNNLIFVFYKSDIKHSYHMTRQWSNNPKRVSKTMYDFVSSRSCVAPNILPVPTQSCTVDGDW
jgi:hypothetical protein